jgi:hypothetical protein
VVHPAIPALSGLRKKDSDFEANLGYIGRPCLKTKTKSSKAKTFNRRQNSIVYPTAVVYLRKG